MNGHTVYLDGSTGIFLLPGVLYDEYGCIVSRGDISFTCNFGASAYMLAWSTEGKVSVDASGEVKGAIFAGESATPGDIEVAPGTTLTWIDIPPIATPPLPSSISSFRITGWESVSSN